MKAFKTTFVIAICALAIGACAKKDSNFASKNAMGARAVSSGLTSAAQAAGIKLDFFGINTVAGSNGTQFRVQLMVNDMQTTATTSQQGTMVARGQLPNIGGYSVLVESVCLDTQCSVLDIAATATAPNGQRYGQVAYKFYRLNADASSDTYVLFDASHVLPFGDLTTVSQTSTVVGFMGQAPDGQ